MIRRLFLFVAGCFLFMMAFAQNLPTTVTAPAVVTPKPVVSSWQLEPSKYYLRTYIPQKPVTDSSLVNMNALVEDVNVSTQYFDELGRPHQTVVKQMSPSKKDYVGIASYDEFGNTSIGYMPYVQQTGNTNDGKFKASVYTSDSAFYKSLFPDEQAYYSLQYFDGSPLQRVTKTLSPGNSWSGSNRGISYSQRANTLVDSVRLWRIEINGEDDIPATDSIYKAGSLIVFETTDERGIKAVLYKDELGRTILSKTQVASSPSTSHSGWLCTYYVYDEFGHLRMVIPPKATEILNGTAVNWNLSGNTSIITGLCYYYWYDNLNRPVMKAIPGKGKSYIAYDLLGRVVMSQDANLRQTNQWAFVKYDDQSRPAKSGLISSSLIKDSVIVQASRSTDYPTLSGTYTITTEAYYDDYGWVSTSGTSLSSTLEASNINSSNFITSFNSSPEYAQQISQSYRIRGASTGVKKLVIGSSTYLFTLNIYDDHGRVIQTKLTNYTNAVDVITAQFSFGGRVLRTHVQHQKGGTNSQSHTLLTKYTYDHAGRVKTIVKNLDNLGDKTITQNTFNELGQLQNKNIGQGIETQTYSYNIRGWLTGINKDYINTSGSTSNYFGEALSYDYGFTNSQYNGAIAGLKWKAAGDGIARAYGFSYDNVARLTGADFSQQNDGSTNWTNDKVDYSVSGLTYDAGSNILTVKQRGLKLGTSVTIDSLTYQYFANSNQLQKVIDGITDNAPLGDFKDTVLTNDDYSYDVNGNITKDYNRHMHTATNGQGAVYNMLDRPDSMVIAGKATLYYYYDVSGLKLRKKINDYTAGGAAVVKDYLYINGFVYLNDTLQYIAQEEGRIRYAKKRNFSTGAIYYAYEYDYFLRDHLGNVRTVLTEGRDTASYVATMEPADSVVVNATFSNVYTPVNTVSPKPTNFDNSSGNNFVSKLNPISGIDKKVGPSLVLKVMAGDKVQVNTFAFYNTAVQPPQPVDLVPELVNLLTAGVSNVSAGKVPVGSNLSTSLNPGISDFLNNNRPYNSSNPKAYLNWILFDDQFNYVASNSGVVQVQAGTSKQALIAPLQTIAKNGYLYVYVSNESPQDVYFDDITITHYTGPLMQEQSYYPFGLQMAGISDKAFNKLTSQYKFNGGVELEEDYGVNLYSTFYREYDPQLGRFYGVDIKSDETFELSNYQFAGNDPVLFNDPLGDQKDLPKFESAAQLMEYVKIHGIKDFPHQFMQWSFGDEGHVQDFSYSDYVSLATNNAGQSGVVVSYSGWTGGYYDKATGVTYAGSVIIGLKFISADKFYYSYSEYKQNEIREKINKGTGAFGTGIGTIEQLFDFSVRSSFKSAKTWSEFRKLRPTQQAWREMAILGKEGQGILKTVKTGGGVLAVASIGYSSYKMANYYANGGKDASVYIKGTLDIAMGIVGFLGPVGFAISTTYFLLDAATDGFGKYGDPYK